MRKPVLTKNGVVAVASFFIIFVTIVILYPSTIYGHANPVSYSPPVNAVINMQQQQSKSLPDKVVILFSERPEPKISYIHVINAKNERVDNNDFKITGKNDREATVTYVFNIQSPQQQSQQQEIISTSQQKNDNMNIFSQHAIVDNVNLTLKITPINVGQNTFNSTD